MPTLPTEPTSTVDTTYDEPTGGTTHNCSTAGQLTTALAAVVKGDIIVLTAGNTFAGPFTLRNLTTQGSGSNEWVYIKSSAAGSLPAAGTRVAPGDATNMAKVTINAADTSAAIKCNDTAHHYRFVGIEITPNTGFVFITLELGGSSQVTAGEIPHHIILDRCYIHGNGSGGRHGIYLNADNGAVIESYINDFWENGNEAHGIFSYNCNGPLKIHNNYIDGAGENILFGGADPPITNVLPKDITITRNTIEKQLSQRATAVVNKNLLELKVGGRVLIEGNLLQNSWIDSDQKGAVFVMTPRNQNGGQTWADVYDVTIRYNKSYNSNEIIRISGLDNYYPTTTLTRLLMEHNLCLSTRLTNTGNGGSGELGVFVNGASHITIRHNTFLKVVTASGKMAFCDANGTTMDEWDITDNIWNGGTGGLGGTGTGEGNATITGHFTANVTLDFNAILGRSASNYTNHTPNYFPTVATMEGEFVDYQTTLAGDFRLGSGSIYAGGGSSDASDSTDLGADIDALEAAMAETGGGGSTSYGSSLGGLG